MRIAIINELYGTVRQGGEQEAIFELSRRLQADTTLQVDIYTYRGRGGEIKIPTAWPAPLRQLPFFRELFVLPHVGRTLAPVLAGRYGAIITSSPILFSQTPPPAPLICVCHAIRSQKAQKLAPQSIGKRALFNSFVQRRLARLEQRAFQAAASVVVLRARMKDFLVATLAIPSDKITILPNAIDQNLFQPESVEKEHVLFVGRATAMKGIDLLLAAAPNIQAPVVVVTKIAPVSVRKKASQAGVKFMFNISHETMPQFYQRAHCLVLPSRDEEMPLTVLEAMACGLPIVVTREAAADIIRDGENGFLLNTGEPKELAERVNVLLANKKLAGEFGQRNRQLIEQQYSWNGYLRTFREILTRLAP
ncbi:MAG: glycosyltransferase family 4 protein [Patescibacteria group bacterium]